MEIMMGEWHVDAMVIEETWTTSQFFMFAKRMTERLQRQADQANGTQRDYGVFAKASGMAGGRYPNLKSDNLKKAAANVD